MIYKRGSGSLDNMVSNEEIRNRLGDKKVGKASNGYLVCDSCEGYYELKSEEDPKDFSSECECGGQLKHSPTNKLYLSQDSLEYKKYYRDIIASYILIVLFVPLALIAGIYLFTRDNVRAKRNGKIITVISAILLILAILRIIF